MLIGSFRAVGLPPTSVARLSASRRENQGHQRVACAAEVYTPTHGWRGFHSANRLVVADNYVKVGPAADCSDVPPTRGTFRRAAAQTLTVDIEIRPRE